MTSKRYPDPRKQIDAGYFWLSIGLFISLLIVLLRPFGIFQITTGLVLYGLYHLVAGKVALKKGASNESIADEWWLESPANEDSNLEEHDYGLSLAEEDLESDEGLLHEPAVEFESELNYESENDFGDEDIFSKSWRDPVYDQDENDDIEDPLDLRVYKSDFVDWDDSTEDSKDELQ